MVLRTIIHIDDSTDMRELTRRALRKIDEQTHYFGFTCGSQGLAWISACPDFSNLVLLLDLHMAEMNGIEILEALGAHGFAKRFPIIMFTSSETVDDRKRCLALGASSYCVKPQDWPGLVAVLRQNLAAI